MSSTNGIIRKRTQYNAYCNNLSLGREFLVWLFGEPTVSIFERKYEKDLGGSQ